MIGRGKAGWWAEGLEQEGLENQGKMLTRGKGWSEHLGHNHTEDEN